MKSLSTAFYTAVADNDSARELMQKDKLRELAVVLTENVRANASIDWIIKESVQAQLRVVIKRTLRKYGYPPGYATTGYGNRHETGQDDCRGAGGVSSLLYLI